MPLRVLLRPLCLHRVGAGDAAFAVEYANHTTGFPPLRRCSGEMGAVSPSSAAGRIGNRKPSRRGLHGLAVRLGWYDQPRFISGFSSMLGSTPGEYAGHGRQLGIEMDDRELAFLGAAQQARMLADGTITAPALLDVYLDRIARLDPELRSYRIVLADSARRRGGGRPGPPGRGGTATAARCADRRQGRRRHQG